MSPERRDGAELRATAGFDFAGHVGRYWGWTAGPAIRGQFSEGEAERWEEEWVRQGIGRED